MTFRSAIGARRAGSLPALAVQALLALAAAAASGCGGSTPSTSIAGDGGAGTTADQSAPDAPSDSPAAGEGGGGDAAVDTSIPGVACGGTMPMFPTFDKTCGTDGDCVIAKHQTSPCGDALDIGISQSAQAMFKAAEAECEKQYFANTCFISNTTLEDGSIFRNATAQSDPVTVTCVSGTCETKNTGMTFACGDKSCAVSGNYCQAYTPAGAATQYKCVLPDSTVACASLTLPTGCTCATASGNVTVTCDSTCTSCGR
jgi:hypothetical protein